ncbi:cation diffusion facilitator family transporter [Pseudomonas sp. UL073]|uniref:Cation diffusion facilitator family transporter n=1 Tax=Zestomonas insulae TaxID=2809017 RepID=A0ABS2IEB4_9GAMM|nr:cation diffusion facilitator family transporter [Pseudomonas insulae]MBM7061434.1 cation diffusion facilitator family transporter [Pseudomonas insulae]
MSLSQQHAQLLRQATLASLCVAGILIVAKGIAWWLSGSVSLLAGLTDSLLDGAASFLNLLAVRYALQPADEDHRYGHGKAEALAAMAQALFIAGSAVLIAVQAFERLHDPQPLEGGPLGMAVMLLALALTVALLMFQQRVIRLTGSTAIRADSLHYRSDLLLNGSILLALALAQFGVPHVDALFGLGIAVYILWSAVSIAREAVAVLMDEELPADVGTRMLELASAVPGVLGVHELRTRVSGSRWFVQVHVELPADMPLRTAHDLGQQAAAAIQNHYPRAEVLVHIDPVAPRLEHLL